MISNLRMDCYLHLRQSLLLLPKRMLPTSKNLLTMVVAKKELEMTIKNIKHFEIRTIVVDFNLSVKIYLAKDC